MLHISQLSFWEKETYFNDIDFLIVGAGITGYSCALNLREKYPNAKILIVERGFLPTGASSKNAGFACFGSATELIDDLSHIEESKVWETFEMRWRGLQNLRGIISDRDLDLQINGSWDLITENEKGISKETEEKLSYLNHHAEKITNIKDVYTVDKDTEKKFGFNNVSTSFFNKLEGQINTGSMVQKFHKIATENNILCLFGIEALDLRDLEEYCLLETSAGEIKANKIAICTNGFAKQFLPQEDVLPARAQVLITKPIDNLKLKGTFHYQQGYYYFRNINNRILLGGGRNLDIKGETTTDFASTSTIQNALKDLLNNVIAPNNNYEIDYSWSGIMGVGKSKKPIIKKTSKNIGVGVRMGGMGVAIGSLVGEELAKLLR
jgi:gamma-glutamylputrescine oxidase